MSASSVSWTADASVRYERLAHEYAKLRSNATVLKNGVLEERAKNEKLYDDLKSTEASVRKLRSENESLTFRNEQLYKRVLTLQDEVETFTRSSGLKREKSHKKDLKPSPVEVDLQRKIELLEEELGNKIKQNMVLVEKISELEVLHSTEMTELSEKFAKELRIMEGQLAAKILSVEPNALGGRDIERQKEGKREIETAVVQPLNHQVQTLESLELLWPAPLPPKSEAYRLCCESGRLCMSAISTFLHLYSERALLFPFDSNLEPVPNNLEKLSADLNKASVQAHLIATTLQEVLDKEQVELTAELTTFRSALSPFCVSLSAIPQGLSTLQAEESKGTWSNAALDRLSTSFYSAFSSLKPLFSHLQTILNEENIDNLTSCLQNMSQVLKELRDSFCARWRLEARLPVATKKFQCVGGALSDCLTQLNAESARLAARAHTASTLQDDVNDSISTACLSTGVIKSDWTSPLAQHLPPTVKNMSQSENTSCIALNEDQSAIDTKCHYPESQSNSVDLIMTCNFSHEDSGRSLESHAENEAHRIRISELETERERLLVEIALLKRRAEKEREERRREKQLGENGEQQLQAQAVDEKKSSDAAVEEPGECSALKHFYNERLRETFHHLQGERERVRYLTTECGTMLLRTRNAEVERNKIEERLKALEKGKADVEDELSTVRRSYEQQLGELTKHVADLNTKMEAREMEKPQSARGSIARKLLFQK